MEGVADDHVVTPVPIAFGHVDDGSPPGHPDDVDHAVHGAELADRFVHHPFDLARLSGISHAGHAAHLGGDLGGQALVDVDADHPGTLAGQGMCGLPPDALSRSEHGKAAPVQAQQGPVVGYR